MNVKQAFQKTNDDDRIIFGDGYFALLYWGGENSKSGPHLINVMGDTAIEIGWDGAFRQAFPASTEGYYPWKEKSKKKRAKYFADTIRQLTYKIEG